MKKFLLLTALAVCGATASAASFADVFSLSYDDGTIEDGQTVVIKDYYDGNADFGGLFPPEYISKILVKATNITDLTKTIDFNLTRIKPTLDEFPSQNSELGNFKLCYDYEFAPGSCPVPTGDAVVSHGDLYPIDEGSYIVFDVEQYNFENFMPTTFQLELTSTDENGVKVSTKFYINFTHERDITNAVEGIEADYATEYFTIQGSRVAEPQKGGIYIERKGNKTSKLIF